MTSEWMHAVMTNVMTNVLLAIAWVCYEWLESCSHDAYDDD